MIAKVNETQFKKVENQLVHIPTGAKISMGSPCVNWGVLDDGSGLLLTEDKQDFQKEDIWRVARILGAGDYRRPV